MPDQWLHGVVDWLHFLPAGKRGSIPILSMDAIRSRQSPQWFWIALLWSGVGLFDATQNVFVMRAEGMHHAWARLFVRLVVAWLPWALGTPVVLFLGRRYPPTKFRPVSTWGIHLGACASIGLVYSAWVGGLDTLLNPWLNPAPPGQ